MPVFVDHLFIAFIALVVPLLSAREHRRMKALYEAGEPFDRPKFYRSTVLWQWAALGVLMITWWWLDRPLSLLGLSVPGGTGFLVSAGLGVAIAAFFIAQVFNVRRMGEPQRRTTREAMGFLGELLPHTDRDVRGFTGVSMTAGIVEEIIFRGFVIAYLSIWMSPLLALVVSSLAFGLGHAYQGPAGILKTGLAGLALGGLYLGSGTLWVPILVHILADALQGVMARELQRTGPSEPQSAPA